jgi:hypothetical protein
MADDKKTKNPARRRRIGFQTDISTNGDIVPHPPNTPVRLRRPAEVARRAKPDICKKVRDDAISRFDRGVAYIGVTYIQRYVLFKISGDVRCSSYGYS